MKKIILLLLLVSYYHAKGQKIIEVSEDYSTVLFFKSDIKDINLGNNKQYGIIQDSIDNNPKTIVLGYLMKNDVIKSTNLTVQTVDDNVYLFRLNYSKEPKETAYLMTNADSKFNIKKTGKSNTLQSGKTNPPKTSKDKKDSIRLARIAFNCKKTNDLKKKIFNNNSEVENVKLSLKEVSYDGEEIYFHLVIKNRGRQDYDVNLFKYLLEIIRKDTDSPSEVINPIYVYNEPKKVKGKSEEHFIVVYEKFTFSEERNIEIIVDEFKGERNLNLKIKNTFIIDPKKLKL